MSEELEEECAVEQSLSVEKEMDVEGSHIMYRQKTDKGTRTLDYDYKRCVGCGLCVRICPTEALEAGPIHEIATGMDAPPVMLDLDKCTFCSMCANFCPVNAFRMSAEGDFPEDDLFPVLEGKATINEKCLPCLLCEATCPEDAIDLEIEMQTKEEIAPFKDGEEGEIIIDENKCTLCGLCARFCDAFMILEKEPGPLDTMPFEQLLVDEDQCDYCVLCADLCPEDAIEVKGTRRGEVPVIEGSARIDQEKCTVCGWCDIVCPYDAVDITKPFEGELKLIDANINKCDPTGCHACFNVCPSHLWYIPESGQKIAARDDLCTYCGACENACPDNVMEVRRDSVRHSPIPDSPWSKQWEDAIDALVSGKRKRPDNSRVLEMPEEKAKERIDIEFPEIDEKLQEKVKEKMEKLRPALKDVKLRRKWEKRKKGTEQISDIEK